MKKMRSIEVIEQPDELMEVDLSMIRGGTSGKDCKFTCGDYCSPDCFCNRFNLWFERTTPIR